MSTKKILMLVGDFVEDYEAMVPFQILSTVGHIVHTVCPGKKAGQTVKTAVHDFEDAQTYLERQGHNFLINSSFDEISTDEYDALVIPGGRAPEYIRLNDKVLIIVRHFANTKKPIASICHGLQVLMAAGVVKGKRCTAYPALKPDLLMAGAQWVDPNQTLSNACVHDNLVTAPAWPAHPEWMRAFLELLDTTIEP